MLVIQDFSFSYEAMQVLSREASVVLVASVGSSSQAMDACLATAEQAFLPLKVNCDIPLTSRKRNEILSKESPCKDMKALVCSQGTSQPPPTITNMRKWCVYVCLSHLHIGLYLKLCSWVWLVQFWSRTSHRWMYSSADGMHRCRRLICSFVLFLSLSLAITFAVIIWTKL